MQNRKDIRWPYLRQIKFQDSFICWKEKKSWEHKNLLQISSLHQCPLDKKDRNVEFAESLSQHKNVFSFLFFLGRADGHLLHSHKRSPVPEKSHHLVMEKKASAYCMRKKPCGLGDRLNTCECQSTLPSHKLQLLLVPAEYDFLHRAGEQSPSPCRIDEQLCMSNSVTFL